MAMRLSDSLLKSPRESAGFAVGNVVWTPSVREGFRRSTIVTLVTDTADDMLVCDESGQQRVRRSDVRPFYDSGPEVTCADNTSLVHLDEANILDNLRRRFAKDMIYTYTANVLLAVNPYKEIGGLYSDATLWEYKKPSVGKPPHPYAIADLAFKRLHRDRKDQAIMVSGESGAGKTETAKIIMRFLTSIARTDAARGGQIQDKIVKANPILESFGNASTVRNHNSSRFGKYNCMYFDQVGALVGGRIKTYLLEVSRVVHQQESEENYHVFYEMLAGLDPDRLDDFELDHNGYYRLLHPGAVASTSGQSTVPSSLAVEGTLEFEQRAARFQQLREALQTVGVQPEVEDEIWEIVAALIHLGEVEFADQTEEDGSAEHAPEKPPEITKRDNLAQAADLLGLKVWRLQDVLQKKKVRDPKGHDMECPRKKSQAEHTMQSLVKILYQRLFDKVVCLINQSSSAKSAGGRQSADDSSAYRHIGILDIYGFERLNTNSLEQLCINLANERLQQFFIEEVLEAEQRMYKEESLNIAPLHLPDSQPVVSSIREVMATLDEHSLRSIKTHSPCVSQA